MAKKLKTILFHYTRYGVEINKKILYTCNYCKWKTVINVTRMYDSIYNKCTKCPNMVKSKSSGIDSIVESLESNENVDFDKSDTESHENKQETQEQKKVIRQRNMTNFVDFITKDEQVSV